MSELRVAILSDHMFVGGGRKASIHFIADALVRRGMDLLKITVGLSPLRVARQPHRYRAVRSLWPAREVVLDDGSIAMAQISPIHPMDLRSRRLNDLFGSTILSLNSRLPERILKRLRGCDIIILDVGTAVSYYGNLRAELPNARFVYNAADLIKAVGGAPYLLQLEKRVLEEVEFVRTPSAIMGASFPSGTHWQKIPHGIDVAAFDRSMQNPYDSARKNFVVGGSAFFDRMSFDMIAQALSGDLIHCFGMAPIRDAPKNVIQYGERPFDELVSYLKFADGGIAPYKIDASSSYLVESSLRIIQYGYMGLPILGPHTDAWPIDIIAYKPEDRASIEDACRRLRVAPRIAAIAKPVTWDEVAERLLKGVGLAA